MPTGDTIRQNRYLRPFRRYLDRHFLWQFNRKAVAGGVAVGLFLGIISPIAQMLLAAIGAIIFRVNLPVAVFATFVTNPFTVPPMYFVAYKIGNAFVETETSAVIAENGTGLSKSFYDQLMEVIGSFHLFIEWISSFGLPLVIGLCVVATLSSVIGYFAVNWLWQLSVRLRWSKRRHRL